MTNKGIENQSGLCVECGEPLPENRRRDMMYHPKCNNKAWARLHRPNKKQRAEQNGIRTE